MKEKKFLKFTATEGTGEVSAIYNEASDPMAQLVLAHGAGAGMEHAFMEELANSLCKSNISVFRFNFPYMEHKKGRPDPPARATLTIRNAIETAYDLVPDIPIFAGGKSFGGRMSSKLAADTDLKALRGLIYFGFPLHAPGRPGIERAAHLKEIPQPMLFLQGTRDTLATPDLIKEVTEPLPTSTVIFYEGADHSFKTLKKFNISPEEMMQKLVDDSRSWISQQI